MSDTDDAQLGAAARPRTALAALSIALLAFLACALVSHFHPPVPQEHDEFSYLLAADTFLAGRLSNPPHPLWPHFESVHILQQPTYCSKYPPLQGLVLAFGERFLGAYVCGVWISFALASAAVFWMLDAWTTRRAAWIASACVALHPQIVAFWGTTLWGGALPLLGAALVWGATPRALRRPEVLVGVAFGLGAGILALSRPFEGAIACAPPLALFAVKLAKRELPGAFFARFAAPAVGVVASALAFLAYYDVRTTGDPLTMPYAVHSRTYDAVPLFLFQSPKDPPEYRHDDLRTFYTDTVARPYSERRSASGFVAGLSEKALLYWRFFVRSGFMLLALGLVAAWSRPGVKFALVSCALFAAALAVETYELPHYAAPFAPALLIVLVACARAIAERGSRARAGAWMLALILVLGMALHVRAAELDAWHHPASPLEDRPAIVEQLSHLAGRHLVIVNSGPGDRFSTEWVYNEPDIENARIVWARAMGDRDEELLSHFADRTVWSIEGDTFARYTRSRPARTPAHAPTTTPPRTNGAPRDDG